MGGTEAFREEAARWLEENCPPAMRTPAAESDDVWGGTKSPPIDPEARLWLDRMAARGWTAPTWPREYGGGGLSAAEARVLAQEMARLRLRPPLVGFGLTMIG